MTDLLDSRVTVPNHVVRREFPEETVVLNLETGKYHGLNSTAAAMLDGLEKGGTPAEVAAQIAEQAGEPEDRVRTDILALVESLGERGLITIGESGG
jgi:hypothetical protein